MYTFEEKEKIIECLKKGTTIEKLHITYQIPVHILYEWQEEMHIRRKIKMLRQEGRLDEAEQELEKLPGGNSNPIRLSIQIGIAKARKKEAKSVGDISREREYREEQKRLLKIQLKNNPNNMLSISSLIVIAREENDKTTEYNLLERQLEIDPNNEVAIMGLISLNTGSKRREKRKELLYRLLELRPDSIKTMITLIRIAEDEGNIEEIERLAGIVLNLEPQNQKVISILHQNGIDIEKVVKETVQDLGEEVLGSLGKETAVQKARRIMHESDNPEQAAEEIKSLLEGQSPTDVALVLAELYYSSGLKTRAEKYLKAYKKTLDVASNVGDIKVINQAIELARSNNTQAFSWNKFWQTEEKAVPEMPEAPGDDGER